MVKKVRMRIRVREQGSRIESVPLRTVERMNHRSHKFWYLDDGWLVLGSS